MPTIFNMEDLLLFSERTWTQEYSTLNKLFWKMKNSLPIACVYIKIQQSLHRMYEHVTF